MKFFRYLILIQSLSFGFLNPGYSNKNVGLKAGLGISNEFNNLADFDYKFSNDFTFCYLIPIKDSCILRINSGYKNRGYRAGLFILNDQIIESGYLLQSYHLITLGTEILLPIGSTNDKLYAISGFDIGQLLNYDPTFGFLIDKKINSYRKIQYDLKVGIGFNINSNLFAEINGDFSIIDKIKSKDRYQNAKAYDCYFGISLGYNI